MSQAIGMMEGAYFVGRVELLNWLNDLLKLDYTKVEQTCTAAAFCQIMDAIYPGQVPLQKVKFNAKQEYEYISNFKVLQTVFDKFGIDKYIDVPKLVKGKYQDNLEFLQWIKRYYDMHNPGLEYDAVDRRRQAGGPAATGAVKSSKMSAPAAKAPVKKATAPAPKATTTTPKTTTAVKPAAKATTSATKVDDQKVQELNQQIADLKVTVDGLEKERDFYFGKLREIEIMCQQQPDQSLEVIQSILKVLYATDENQEFVSEEQAAVEEQVYEEQSEEQPQAVEDSETF